MARVLASSSAGASPDDVRVGPGARFGSGDRRRFADDFGVRVSDEASRATGLRGEDTSDWSLKKVSQ